MPKDLSFLLLAIFTEVIGTVALKTSYGFTKLVPTLIVLVSYLLAFYFLSQSVKTFPLGSAYAIWSGLGTLATAIIGWIFFKDPFNLYAICGVALILIGVAILNMSRTA
jgi:multidrug transporter EmrE-like cation transporter